MGAQRRPGSAWRAGCFNSGFLPASFKGSIFKGGDTPLANINPAESRSEGQRRQLDLLRTLDQGVLGHTGCHDALRTWIANYYELAARVQTTALDLMAVDGEFRAIRVLYRLGEPYVHDHTYARQCLTTRRLV